MSCRGRFDQLALVRRLAEDVWDEKPGRREEEDMEWAVPAKRKPGVKYKNQVMQNKVVCVERQRIVCSKEESRKKKLREKLLCLIFSCDSSVVVSCVRAISNKWSIA